MGPRRAGNRVRIIPKTIRFLKKRQNTFLKRVLAANDVDLSIYQVIMMIVGSNSTSCMHQLLMI
jgi:hypothetical protein